MESATSKAIQDNLIGRLGTPGEVGGNSGPCPNHVILKLSCLLSTAILHLPLTMLLRRTLRSRTWHLRSPALYRSRSIVSIPLIDINRGTFYRQYPSQNDGPSNPPLFPNLEFKLPAQGRTTKSKQYWAVVGPSSRTEFLNVLRGQHISIPASARSYPYLLSEKVADKDPNLRLVGNAIQYIGFSGEGSSAIGGTRGAYLSARYESFREETDWTVEQYLRGQTSLNPMEGEEKGTVYDDSLFQGTIAQLNLGDLLSMPVANLSNGQTRRARVARALLKQPELLLLDEPFMGLDPPTVKSMSEFIHRLAKNCSPRVILALRPQDDLPDWITHLVLVGHNNHILHQGPREKVEERLRHWSAYLDSRAKAVPDAIARKISKGFWALEKSGALDEQLAHELLHRYSRPSSERFELSPRGEPLIEMTGVRVQYGEKVVLGDWKQSFRGQTTTGLHWRVRRGQRWAVLGTNGSGKTTLLSLITSDHPQTYALPVKLFGRSRLPEAGKPGLSIFELQSRIGHSSPEIHAFFPRQLTVRQAIESAFAETFLSKPELTVERDRDVDALLIAFKAELGPNATTPSKLALDPEVFPTPKANKAKYAELMESTYGADYADDVLFGQLTTSQQRIVLFLRALVHKPDIVMLDEAFSGLSYTQRDKCLHFLDHGAKNNTFPGLSDEQALIVISHVKEEIPDSVRYYLRLPVDSGDGSKPSDFRAGVLKSTSVLRNKDVWDNAWRGPSSLDKAKTTDHDGEIPDMLEYDYQTL